MFLYKEEEVADEDYQHHPLSNSNNPSATNSASKHNPLYSSSNHSSAQKARKNKQFQGYQTIMNSNIGTYGGKYTIDKKNNLASAANNTNPTSSNIINNGTNSSIKKSTLRPDEDMVTTIHNRKRRIVLSDDEGDSGAENELGSEVKGVSGGSGHKRRRANSEGMKLCEDAIFCLSAQCMITREAETHCSELYLYIYITKSHYYFRV